MVANPATPKLDEAKHSLPAASAAWSSRLQLRPTLIAKHQFAFQAAQVLSICYTKASTQQFRNKIFSSQFSVNPGPIIIIIRKLIRPAED
jgi:hypothetical protein